MWYFEQLWSFLGVIASLGITHPCKADLTICLEVTQTKGRVHSIKQDHYFSVAKATLESLMSLEGVVILNLRCGYIENGVVILKSISVRHQNPSASQNHAYQPNLSLSAIMPSSHQGHCHQPSRPSYKFSNYAPPTNHMYLSAIIHISHHSYLPSYLLTIMPINNHAIMPIIHQNSKI